MLGTTRCPRCAKHLPSDSAFCRRCGRDLRAPHGLAGVPSHAPSLPRREVPPPPVPHRQRGGGKFAIIAFALFALLFILGLLFSTRPGRIKYPAPVPAEERNVEGQSEWGSDHAGSTDSPRRQDSGKPRW